MSKKKSAGAEGMAKALALACAESKGAQVVNLSDFRFHQSYGDRVARFHACMNEAFDIATALFSKLTEEDREVMICVAVRRWINNRMDGPST